MEKREIMAIHLLILISLSVLTIFLFSKYSTEDSYITYRYAQNLVDGKGFSYNSGDEHFGTTAPFYALILALFGYLGFNIPSLGGILSAFSLGMSTILIYLMTLKRGYPLVGLLCGSFVFLNPWFLQTFGSETFFQLLMVVGAFYFYDQKKYLPTAVFCALAFLTRADGILPAIIISVDYMISNRKFPVKGTILFFVLCVPFFLFYYLNFNALLPATLEAKQAQYASGLWRNFLPGILNFSKLLLKENILFYFFMPLFLVGGILILFSRKIWLLMATWAILHILGYTFLKVSFYHWYPIPLLFLLMLMSAFSLHLILSVPRFFEEKQTKKWNMKIFNQDIKLSIARYKEINPFLKWTYRILSIVVLSSIILVFSGGVRAYSKMFRSLPFPKLELYAKAGSWIAKNTPTNASLAAMEIGYLGYYAQRKVIDLIGLVTPEVSEHLRRGDFQWVIKKHQPDYFIYNEEFKAWLEPITYQPWFEKSYEHVIDMSQSGYPFNLRIFKKVLPLEIQEGKLLVMDSRQDVSNFDVGEIIGGREIGQTFYCTHDHLARIQVMLATFSRENHHEVIFHLKKSPAAKEDIYTERFNASSVVDNAYRSFDFPSIPDSKGKWFYFSFESPESRKGDAITIWANSGDGYDNGSLYIDLKKSEGDLRFITYYYKYEIFINEK